MVCDFVAHSLTRLTRNGDPATDGADAIVAESGEIPREDSLANEIAECVDCIRVGRKPTVDGRVGREALGVATRITESIRNHRARVEAQLGA